MRNLRPAAFKKTEAQFRKRVEHAAEHEIGDGNGILHRVAKSAPETITARGVMARHAPAPDDRAGVHRMKNDRHTEFFGFGVNRPELFAVKILVADGRIADRRP